MDHFQPPKKNLVSPTLSSLRTSSRRPHCRRSPPTPPLTLSSFLSLTSSPLTLSVLSALAAPFLLLDPAVPPPPGHQPTPPLPLTLSCFLSSSLATDDSNNPLPSPVSSSARRPDAGHPAAGHDSGLPSPSSDHSSSRLAYVQEKNKQEG